MDAELLRGGTLAGSPIGTHRVLEPVGALPQAAYRLDNRPDLWDSEARIRVELLHLDAASYRQLRDMHGGDPGRLRAALLETCAERGKLQNPVTGSGGRLVGTVDAVGTEHHQLGGDERVVPGARVATLVSLAWVPLWLTDVSRWDGSSEVVPASGHAIVFARSAVGVVPDDLELATVVALLDVAAAPALMARHVPRGGAVAVIGGSGRAGSLACVAARRNGARHVVAVVPTLADVRLVDHVGAAEPVVADARDPVTTAEAIREALGGPADLTFVCVDVAGAETGALLATAQGGRVVFFSMTTDLATLALGAEGLGADLDLLVGNGYVPGHAALAIGLLRDHPALHEVFRWRAGVGPDPTRPEGPR